MMVVMIMMMAMVEMMMMMMMMMMMLMMMMMIIRYILHEHLNYAVIVRRAAHMNVKYARLRVSLT